MNKQTEQIEKEYASGQSPSNGGLDAELVAFERICADLLSVEEKSRLRIVKAVSQLLGLEIGG